MPPCRKSHFLRWFARVCAPLPCAPAYARERAGAGEEGGRQAHGHRFRAHARAYARELIEGSLFCRSPSITLDRPSMTARRWSNPSRNDKRLRWGKEIGGLETALAVTLSPCLSVPSHGVLWSSAGARVRSGSPRRCEEKPSWSPKVDRLTPGIAAERRRGSRFCRDDSLSGYLCVRLWSGSANDAWSC
jgi:hypothetical protein